MQDLNQQLAALTEGNATLKRQIEEQRAAFEAENAELEHTLADINGAESKALELQASVQEDLRRQARAAEVSSIFSRLR